MSKSAKIFEKEGTYPVIYGSDAMELDNWTDALMLQAAVFDKVDSSPLEKAMGIYMPVFDEDGPVGSLLCFINKNGELVDKNNTEDLYNVIGKDGGGHNRMLDIGMAILFG